MSILDDTYCIYCSREFKHPRNLQRHVTVKHKNTYAYHAIREAKKK